jgi:hypothetical protein
VNAVERRMTTSLSGADLAVLRGWLTDCARNLTTEPVPSPVIRTAGHHQGETP